MSLTAKDMKKMWRPKFAEEAEKYYPSEVFKKFNYTKAKCPKCGTLYWRRGEKAVTCGDSECLGEYTFINKKINSKVEANCADVFKSFQQHFEQTQPFNHTLVKRYPVVARWRDDCEFTAAGIQCYQPFCVTGEVDPPANPLVQAQFCLRFNDLDSIGISGRHYSGFHMLGIQVFNKKTDHKYWKDGIVEYNLLWLEKLGIDLDEVTLTADCWAGGGNLGPCVEYFINGLEVGNMVFMEFKCFSDGTIEQLPVQVIDVGIGLERIPWLLSGNVTSYVTAFPTALPTICQIIGLTEADLLTPAWQKFAKYSCLLNVDEVQDISIAWKEIATKCGYEDVVVFQNEITKARDAYIVLDHLRSILAAVQDGGLPGNVGGGCNLRNVLRRAFTIIEKRGWNALFEPENFRKMFDVIRFDLQQIHGTGTFQSSDTLCDIAALELQRWKVTDEVSKQKVQKLLKKTGHLEVNDWITAVTTFGMDPDSVSKITGELVPADLYCKIAEFQERNLVKQAQIQHYILNNEKSTDQLYYSLENGETVFEYNQPNKIQKILNDCENQNMRTILILEKTIFYPTAGGQQHDTGMITINGAPFKVINVTKVGPCVLHYLETELPNSIQENAISTILLKVDADRRLQLMQHHTGAHVLAAACRLVLGPHVWQAGAKKQPEYATLDVTHYQSISYQQQRAIQKQCQRIIQQNKKITKQNLDKSEAEKRYGFELYQGGVVPGSSVRCVCIDETDNEACCGTHLESTAQIGMLKIQKINRISDGVVRIQFVCGEAALTYDDEEMNILETLKRDWSIDLFNILNTATKFFDGFKYGEKMVNQLQKELLKQRITSRVLQKVNKYAATENAPTRYLTEIAECLAEENNGDVSIGCKLQFSGESYVVFAGTKADIKAVLDQVAQLGVKAKTMPMKVAKGKQSNGELMLVTGLSDKKLYEKIAAIW